MTACINLVNFMTLLLLLSKMFLSFSVSQYFTFSILYNVLCTYLSLHAHCHCNVCIAVCVANKLLHSVRISEAWSGRSLQPRYVNNLLCSAGNDHVASATKWTLIRRTTLQRQTNRQTDSQTHIENAEKPSAKTIVCASGAVATDDVGHLVVDRPLVTID